MEPEISLFIPISLYSVFIEIPDFPFNREVFISLIPVPIGEMAPRPVLTALFNSIILKTRWIFE